MRMFTKLKANESRVLTLDLSDLPTMKGFRFDEITFTGTELKRAFEKHKAEKVTQYLIQHLLLSLKPNSPE